MKIIGKAGRDTFLIEASSREVAQILGVASEYSLKEVGIVGELEPGSTINVSGIYGAVALFRSQGKHAAETAKTLRDLADKVDQAARIIKQPVEVPKG